MSETDMAHLMRDNELDALQIVVFAICHLKQVGHDHHILPSKDKGRHRIEHTALLGKIDLRGLLHAKTAGIILDHRIDLREILLRDTDGIGGS